ncbi:hypothetical protein ACFX1X_032492 [Malus domestica]
MAFSALSWTYWEREAEDEQKSADRDWVRSWVPMTFGLGGGFIYLGIDARELGLKESMSGCLEIELRED